jgi:hypothetical protein
MSKSIEEKLKNIQQKLNAPKNQYNSFGKYKYRSLEDILVAVKPHLEENKCVLVFNDTLIESGQTFVLECSATITCIESKDEVIVRAIVGVDVDRKGMDIAQSFGASSSYGRKYAANGLFLIDDTKDADATNDHGKSASKSKPAPATLKTMTDKEVESFIKGISEGKFVVVENYLTKYSDDTNKAKVVAVLNKAKTAKQ